MLQMVFRIVWLMMLAGTAMAMAEGDPAPPQSASAESGMLPIRLEFGGYYSWADHGYGNWRGLDADLWLNRRSRFIPGFMIDSQTRPSGTQQNYAFVSYMNWTPSLYSIQSISFAPQRSREAIFFPKERYDFNVYWKLPPKNNLALGAGFTYFDFGSPGRGQIYNLGSVYYHNRLVLMGNLYINESQPGSLWSASGAVSAQYGTEGKYWFGLTASGGKELYRIELVTPQDVGLTSYTLDLFYRRWITRHMGYVLGAIYQDKLDAYRRAGASVRIFFDF